MIRVFYILHKKQGMDDQAFREYWKNVHGPIAAKLPGLRKYVQSHCYPDPYGAPLPADGVEDLEFDSVEAMQAALATPAGRTMLADMVNFLDPQSSGPVVVGEDYQII